MTNFDYLSTEDKQYCTPVSNMIATTVNNRIMATGDLTFIQLQHTPTVEGTLSKLNIYLATKVVI